MVEEELIRKTTAVWVNQQNLSSISIENTYLITNTTTNNESDIDL